MNKENGFDKLSVLLECSTGNTPTVNALKKYIDLIAAFGYTHFYLGLTDAYKIEGEPYFNFCRGGYTTEQLQDLDAYAESKGVELRANVQVLGHLAYMKKYNCYADLFDTDDILMVGKDEVYDFVEKIFATMSKGIKSRTIHIGMDEAYNLGLGRYKEENGYTDKRELLLYHLNRVVEIAKKYNYTCEIWSDMFFTLVKGSGFNDDGVIPEDVRESIPEGVSLVHWSYDKQTEEVIEKHMAMNKAICDSLVFAGAVWKCMGLAPMNQYSMDVMERQIKVCKKQNVEHYMVTLWSDTGAHCSIFAVLPALFAVAEMATGKTQAELDKDKFKEIVGVSFDDYMLLDDLNNPFHHEVTIRANRSYWGLHSDIFMGMYDWMLENDHSEAYETLAKQYEEVSSGDYQLVFHDFATYAKVLSIKMNLGVKVRTAYHEGNKELLKQYARVDIPQMITYMQEFMQSFQKRWLSENSAFGLEVHQLFYGGAVERWRYTAERLERYLADGEPIEEMEREELPPSVAPGTDEDNLRVWGYRNLISYCGI